MSDQGPILTSNKRQTIIFVIQVEPWPAIKYSSYYHANNKAFKNFYHRLKGNLKFAKPSISTTHYLRGEARPHIGKVATASYTQWTKSNFAFQLETAYLLRKQTYRVFIYLNYIIYIIYIKYFGY